MQAYVTQPERRWAPCPERSWRGWWGWGGRLRTEKVRLFSCTPAPSPALMLDQYWSMSSESADKHGVSLLLL